MSPDEPASHASPESSTRRATSGSRGDSAPASPARLVVTVLAVAFAVIGLVALAVILITALLQGTVWPGFVVASYFCLPLAFLLMAALVVGSVVTRRRS